MVFILYKLYVLLPYTYPTPKLSPHKRRCISTFPQKTHSVWLCMNYGDTDNILINHLLLVIPVIPMSLYRKRGEVLSRCPGQIHPLTSDHHGLLIIPIHWLASSLCLLSTSKLVCGGRSGAIWLPSHHPGGCCTLVVDEEMKHNNNNNNNGNNNIILHNKIAIIIALILLTLAITIIIVKTIYY